MASLSLLEGLSHGGQLGIRIGRRGHLIGRAKGGMNTKLPAIYDSKRPPINLLVSAGQVSDYIGARALLNGLPNADGLLSDRSYDADWFREAPRNKGIPAYIPGREQSKTLINCDHAARTAQPH